MRLKAMRHASKMRELMVVAPKPYVIWVLHPPFIPDILRLMPTRFPPVAILHSTPSVHIGDFVLARPKVVSFVPPITEIEYRRPCEVVFVFVLWSAVHVHPSRPSRSPWSQRWTVDSAEEYVGSLSCEDVFQPSTESPFCGISGPRILGPDEAYSRLGFIGVRHACRMDRYRMGVDEVLEQLLN